MSGDSVISVEATLLAVGVLGGTLFVVRAVLARKRPGLLIGQALGAAAILRVASVVVLGSSGAGGTLRGDDEPFLIGQAQAMATNGANYASLALHKMHLFVPTIGFKLGFGVGDVRVFEVMFTIVGIALIAAAAYDLAGARAGHLAAWLLALEPANVFYSSVIHKEPIMYLAGGLVVLGCTRLWTRLDWSGVPLAVAGCALAITVRAYAGWFLVGACLLLVLHASLRHATRRPGLAVPLLLAAGGAIAIGLGPALHATSGKTLHQLQVSQRANANDTSNLRLEPVDFSSRTAAIGDLPKRIRDVLFKPYPWQVSNLRQQLGLIGTLAALAALFLLVRYAWWSAGAILTRTAPLFYPGMALLIAFSLSAGNAGTSFRYRTNLIAIVLAALVVLRARVLADHREAAPDAADGLLASPAGHVPGRGLAAGATGSLARGVPGPLSP